MNGYSQGSCSDQILITAKGRSVNRIVLKPARPIPIGPGSIYIHRGCSLGPVWLASVTHPLHTILAPHSIEIGWHPTRRPGLFGSKIPDGTPCFNGKRSGLDGIQPAAHVLLPFILSFKYFPSSLQHAFSHAHHANLPGISFASLCPAPFKKPKMASSFAIPDSILSDYSMPLIACNTHPAPLPDSKPYRLSFLLSYYLSYHIQSIIPS